MLNDLPKDLMIACDDAAYFGAREWEELAKRDAPSDLGKLKGGISYKKIKQGEWEVVSTMEYSAYVEWGTRLKVRVPAELQVYAAQFKGGNGKGDAKKFIFEWCKRVGVPEEAWWLVYISIMRNGITPHPYFFPQRPIVEKLFIQDLNQVLNTPR